MVASADSSAPLVVVSGATGNQGGSVVKALLESDKPYRIRGLTRDATKPPALKLKEKGVEPYSVKSAELLGTMEIKLTSRSVARGHEADVAKAFQGASWVFNMTDFWRDMNMEREVAEGKLVVDAVKSSGATLIWSGLDSYKLLSKGKYPHVDHYEGKYQITQYAQEQGVPTIVVKPGFYAINFTTPSFGPRKNEDGSYVFATTFNEDSLLAVLDTEHDYGLFVRAAIEHYKPGDELDAYSEDIKIIDLVNQLAEVSGKKISFHHLSDDQLVDGMKASGSPDAVTTEISEMVFAQRDLGYFGGRDLQPSQEHLARPTRTWKQFAEQANWSAIFK